MFAIRRAGRSRVRCTKRSQDCKIALLYRGRKLCRRRRRDVGNCR